MTKPVYPVDIEELQQTNKRIDQLRDILVDLIGHLEYTSSIERHKYDMLTKELEDLI